jgi:hypothetical protein
MGRFGSFLVLNEVMGNELVSVEEELLSFIKIDETIFVGDERLSIIDDFCF